MHSKLFQIAKRKYEDKKVQEIPGYLKLCKQIQDNAEEGSLIFDLPTDKNWPFSEQALIRLKEHDGFNIILNGAGAARMSISLVGVTRVVIDWKT